MGKFNLDTTKRTGVWLDKDKAIIVTLYDHQTSVNTILSKLEHFRPHGGSGTRFKGGPQDVVQDSKFLEREKHQLKNYFKNLAKELKSANAIVLFGPAETCLKFNKELKERYKDISAKVKDVVKADSMTKAQIKSWVKHFFKSSQ